MRFSRYILVLSYAILIHTNCVKEFDPPSGGYENLLVVEAFLSDGNEPFEVLLSRSVQIDTSTNIAETGANVRLSEESGKLYHLTETEKSGRYLHSNINARVGETYQLHITTQDGHQYESAKVVMRPTPEIDSVTFKYEERPAADLKGIQIYVNTHDAQNNTFYYRWEWEETWVFFTPYPSSLVYIDGEIYPREDNINRCWKKSTSTSIEIATSKNLTEDVISEYPLLYVATNTDRLGVKYSLNVSQYALSEKSYNYWVELQKATESLGTLFDPQPSTVFGNIYNISNDSEVVLGYFDASSKAEKRIFIKRGDLPYIGIPNYYDYCEDSIVSRDMIEEMMEDGYMLAYETRNDFGGIEYVMSSNFCIDCTLAGTNEIPEFWE
ncbi:MAG: DUF4249 domain-containing protein [Cytophagales bacterium]|nr:DUF4249 domain-containing protein [Cytophagales bacterium]